MPAEWPGDLRLPPSPASPAEGTTRAAPHRLGDEAEARQRGDLQAEARRDLARNAGRDAARRRAHLLDLPATGSTSSPTWNATVRPIRTTKPVSELTWRWWEMMAPYMETNPDFSPVQRPVEEMFNFENR
jgi:hypothetical protein